MILGIRFTGICDLDIESLLTDTSGLPSLEYLHLKLNNSICTETDRFFVKSQKIPGF
jgi:hypothetical protein